MDRSRLKLDILALTAFFALVFLVVSLASYDAADPPSPFVWPNNSPVRNLCGRAGATAAYALVAGFGLGTIPVLIGLAAIDLLLFLRRPVTDRLWRLFGWLLLVASTCAGADLLIGPGPSTVLGSGGCLGVYLAVVLRGYFSSAGACLVVAAAGVVGSLLTFDYAVVRALGLLLRPVRSAGAALARVVGWTRRRGREPFRASGSQTAPTSPDTSAALAAAPGPIPIHTPDELAAPEDGDIALRLDRAISHRASDRHYQLPPLELLDDPESFEYEAHTARIRHKAQLLEQTLAEFGYNVRVVQIDTGPVITQYEIALEAGLRVGKIHSLAEDLAINLRVPAVRIVAPIPGKDTVGVEVPNDQRKSVRLKEVIRSAGNKAGDMRIPLFVGKDVKGGPLAFDLTEMPHLLIAGRTGTGKSVCLNAMILSILMTRRPDEVKMLMIDPKMVELSQYRRIPHLMHPVVTDMKKAEAMLAWAVDKMEERYDLLMRAGVRHVDTYNQLGAEEIYARLKPADEQERARIPEHMPYIVIFADEMADLMMTAPKEVESYIIRLAQKSRAVGIHLVVATQKPTVDVVTGLIKSNLPARIAFQVSSRSDSRVVLDEVGAEKLLGQGDMLFLIPGTSRLIRAQGTHATDTEIDRVVQFLESYEPEYTRELLQISTGGQKQDFRARLRQRDELYEQAIEIVVREGRGSVSLLQRALGIGYGRAARLIDYMAEDGLVGDYNGSQAREVLCSPEEWDQMRAGASSGHPA